MRNIEDKLTKTDTSWIDGFFAGYKSAIKQVVTLLEYTSRRIPQSLRKTASRKQKKAKR